MSFEPKEEMPPKYIANLTTNHYVDYEQYLKQKKDLVGYKKVGFNKKKPKFWLKEDKIIILFIYSNISVF